MRSTYGRFILLLIVGLACVSAGTTHAADTVEELKACAKMADRDARFNCYENLGRRVLRESLIVETPLVASPVVASPVVVSPVAASPVVASPVVASPVANNSIVESPVVEKLPVVVDSPPAAKEAQVATTTVISSNGPVVNDAWRFKDLETRLTITSCRQGFDNKWFFFFDNGQVWKQVDTSRRRFADCNFTATLIKDGFGHKILIDGEKRKFRITRKR